jgi:class 3 adenylate cyclase/CHASE2 domain-containing sensor protein
VSKRLLALALIVVAAVGIATLLDLFGNLSGVRALEDRTLDWRQQTTAETFQNVPGRQRESDIALVLFDELAVTDPDFGWAWEQPFPRSHLAELVDAVSAAGAQTIGLDVFLELRYKQLNDWRQGDDKLHDALERAGNVILVAPVVQTDSGPVMKRPDPYFADVAAGIGAAEIPSAFETFRDGTLAVRSGAGLAPSFSLALYAHSKGFDVDSLLLQSRRWGRVPLEGLPQSVGQVPEEWFVSGSDTRSTIVPFRIRFVGPPSGTGASDPPGTFQATGSSSAALMATLDPSLFEGKIVLLGSGFHDSDKFRTPFYGYRVLDAESSDGPDEYSWMYGVEIHANALQNMLDGEYVTPLGPLGELVLLFLVALIGGGVAFWKGTAWGGAATLLSLAGVIVYAWWAWAGTVYGPGGELFDLGSRFVWVPVITPIVAGSFSYVGSVAYVAIVEGKEKRFIKSAFGKYVSPEVVAEISEDPNALQLGGQKRTLSLLFSDLAGFTTLSERMDPQDLLAELNEYLSEMTQIVMDEGGTLDKYIGDAIMAFWNAPKDLPDHADRAIRTAIIMQRRMDDLNARWRESDPDHETLVVRIGVNSGEVVVGNVGGEERFDYSAIGDAVNLAARLEPANKTYDTLNMVSQFTLDAADASKYRVRELDFMAVKGKEEPVKVYELLEMTGETLAPDREEAIARYEEGMKAYKSHDWAAAEALFRAALEACPDDGPSRVYAERSAEHVADPPPPDWDFVVRRTVK